MWKSVILIELHDSCAFCYALDAIVHLIILNRHSSMPWTREVFGMNVETILQNRFSEQQYSSYHNIVFRMIQLAEKLRKQGVAGPLSPADRLGNKVSALFY